MATDLLSRNWPRTRRASDKSRPRFVPRINDILEDRTVLNSTFPGAVTANWSPDNGGTLVVSFKIAGGKDNPVYAGVFINGDHPMTAVDTSGFNLDGSGHGSMRFVSNTFDTVTTFTQTYTSAGVQAKNGHADALATVPDDVCVVMYHNTSGATGGTATGSHSNIGTGPG